MVQAADLGLDLHPRSLLVLLLCLAQAVHMQEGLLPKPSIRAVPGPVLRRGETVTIVCRGPAGAGTFRLQEKENASAYRDQKITSPSGSHRSKAIFPIDAVSEFMTRSYFCVYQKGSIWSNQSKILELKVADEDISTPPSGPTSQNYMVGNCVHIGLAAVVLLILVAILAEAGHSWHRWPHRPQEQRQGS